MLSPRSDRLGGPPPIPPTTPPPTPGYPPIAAIDEVIPALLIQVPILLNGEPIDPYPIAEGVMQEPAPPPIGFIAAFIEDIEAAATAADPITDAELNPALCGETEVIPPIPTIEFIV